jgi:hypothetical protein
LPSTAIYLAGFLLEEISMKIDLIKPEHSYMIGFIQTDGHLGKNKNLKNYDKGKMVISLNKRDIDILNKISKLIDTYIQLNNYKKKDN